MGVYIKKDIPESCGECFVAADVCRLWEDFDERTETRHPDCPLVEIKTPHGDLIERVPTITKIQKIEEEPQYQHDGEDWINGLIQAEEVVRYAPTVIEAEGEK